MEASAFSCMLVYSSVCIGLCRDRTETDSATRVVCGRVRAQRSKRLGPGVPMDVHLCERLILRTGKRVGFSCRLSASRLSPLSCRSLQKKVRVVPDKLVSLLLDRARWYKNPHLAIPGDIHVLFLPPYSNELRPKEKALAALE